VHWVFLARKRRQHYQLFGSPSSIWRPHAGNGGELGSYGDLLKEKVKVVGFALFTSNTMARCRCFLLTVFGKGEKANLSKSERNQLAKFTSLLRKHYGGNDD